MVSGGPVDNLVGPGATMAYRAPHVKGEAL